MSSTSCRVRIGTGASRQLVIFWFAQGLADSPTEYMSVASSVKFRQSFGPSDTVLGGGGLFEGLTLGWLARQFCQRVFYASSASPLQFPIGVELRL